MTMAEFNRYAYRTYTGLLLDLSDPQPEDFNIPDIAHQLARVSRFGGAMDGFYSVGSHSVYVARRLEELGHARSVVVAGLMHDASEAYLGDMVSGLKRLMPEYRMLEERYEAAIIRAFGLNPNHHRIVKEADLRARLSEIRDLFRYAPYPRELLLGGEDGLDPYAARVVEETPDEAELSFLAMAARLGLPT